MATKKPTAKQLAARRLFAQRAKAGTLGGKKRAVAKKATARKPAAKKIARRAAPVRRISNPTTMLAIKVNGGNDRSGNPRRGWIIVEIAGERCTMRNFVSEGYSGDRALSEAGYAGIASIGVFDITASQYAAFRKSGE